MRLIQTCPATPEQYDVFDEDELVGYLRLRHGHFTAHLDGPRGQQVYAATPEGDGMFYEEEREFFIGEALAAIVRARTRTILDRMGYA